jgi:hypothetical protein
VSHVSLLDPFSSNFYAIGVFRMNIPIEDF